MPVGSDHISRVNKKSLLAEGIEGSLDFDKKWRAAKIYAGLKRRPRDIFLKVPVGFLIKAKHKGEWGNYIIIKRAGNSKYLKLRGLQSGISITISNSKDVDEMDMFTQLRVICNTFGITKFDDSLLHTISEFCVQPWVILK